MSYVIGSGWWSTEPEVDTRDQLLGDHIIRSQQFHKLWYESIKKYSSPDKIIIVDSCSPVKPQLDIVDDRIEFISLNVNAGHSTNHQGKFCGYTRAIILGLEYALQCNTDYYVYVEQDALIYGEGVIESCIEEMTTPYMFGSGTGTVGRLQQSFFIIRQDAIWSFLKKIKAINQTDNEICPEEKFHLACSYGPAKLMAYIVQKSKSNAFFRWLEWQSYKYLKNWEELPIGFGRVRPIDFDAPSFYFQHGNQQELESFLTLSGIKWDDKN